MFQSSLLGLVHDFVEYQFVDRVILRIEPIDLCNFFVVDQPLVPFESNSVSDLLLVVCTLMVTVFIPLKNRISNEVQVVRQALSDTP